MSLLNLFSNPAYQGLLSEQDQDALRRQSLLSSGVATLLASSGGQPGTGRVGLLPALAQGLQAGQQAYSTGAEGILRANDLKQKQAALQQRKQILGSIEAQDPAQMALSGGGGPTMANAEKMQEASGKNLSRMMDAYRQALLLDDGGKTAAQIKALIEIEKPTFEYATSFEIEGEGGKPIAVAMGKDGSVRTVGGKAVKLETRDLGDRIEFINPYTNKVVGTSAKGQTPDSRASTALGYSKLQFERDQANRPQYDFSTVDGRVVVGDKRTGQIIGSTNASPKDVQQITGATNAVLEAAAIIPKSTGSVVGRGLDLAAGAFGFGTTGAENTAKLEVIGAKLTANVPRFEGPQSNIDVQFYKQAAADVSNPLKPASVRLEALKTAAELIRKDAQTKGIPVPPEFDAFLSGNNTTTPQQNAPKQGGVVDFNSLPKGKGN